MGILNNILKILSVLLVTDAPCSTVRVSVLVCTREDTNLVVKKQFLVNPPHNNEENIDRNISQTERLWYFIIIVETSLCLTVCV